MAINISRTESLQKLGRITKKSVEESNSKLVKDIPLDEIVPNPDNIKLFTMENVEGLVESIKSIGFNGAIDVYRLPGGKYQISSGHRRYAAVKRLGWRTIPCIIMEPEDDILVRKKLVESNINTRVLSPIELARSIQYYETILREENFKGDINTRLGEIFSISRTKVSKLKSLLKLADDIQELAKAKNFPYEAFEDAVNFPAEKQKQLADRLRKHLEKNPTAEIDTPVVNMYVGEIKNELQIEKDRKEREKLEQAVQEHQEMIEEKLAEKLKQAEEDKKELELENVDLLDSPSIVDSLPKFEGHDRLPSDVAVEEDSYGEVQDIPIAMSNPKESESQLYAYTDRMEEEIKRIKINKATKEALIKKLNKLIKILESM
ncbi:ParB/RepB/Spo0J family partition protein [Butyrivibrio sp. M55]|uniref:ParB/RepB/Spo0J family partition protein n=1 Tax=Butyrivibrio sp. M55 TaxID=1855323 RepID=UPI0008E4916B|nr:ParB/RepB/Spo0J family partition protein [Butyrivibrio sp. M55]SFU91094.1 ParB/RepB/Spo0J family partition protein [Butyrivibrio sp. M55]